MRQRVRKEGNKVWIDGIAPWRPNEMTNSVMAALAVATQSMDTSASYEYLMGVSGTAFRLQFGKGWCPSSPHSHCGYKTVSGAVDALPYELAVFEADAGNREAVAQTKAAVKQSIDRGLPAVYGREEDGLIVGYQGGGEQWLCVHPYRASEGLFLEDEWPWGVGVFTERKTPLPDPRLCVQRSLDLADTLARKADSGQYACGFHAWDEWTKGLRNDEYFATLEREPLLGIMRGNFWIFMCLMDARRAAYGYLRDAAGRFEGEAADHLLSLSDIYKTMVDDVLVSGRSAVIPPWELGEGETWSAESRHAEARILEEAESLERQAIETIHKMTSVML
jgi:hypothetical protein